MNDVTRMDPRDVADQRASTGVAVQDLTGRPPLHASVNHGSVAIEQERAIAEVQGQIIIAQRCPRDVVAATAEFLEACKMPEFAAKAFYSVPNRGSGPSIRFAEEAARCYGNFQFGHRELSRSEGKSEVEVYAWDVQKNNRSTRQITVMHVMDSRNGSRPLKDQADIDNRIANVASKQMRGRILALLPKSMVAAGEAMAKKTLAGDTSKPLSARIVDMTQAFADHFSVNVAMLETYIGHSLQTVTIDEFADMTGVFNALREGGKVSEYFNADGEVPGGETAERNTTLDAAAARGRQTRTVKKVEPGKDGQSSGDGASDKKSDDKKADDKKTEDRVKEDSAKDRQRDEERQKTDQQQERQSDRRQQSEQREQPRDDRDDRQQERRDDRQQEQRRDPPREERQQEQRDERDPPRDDRREERRDDRDPRDDDDRRDPRDQQEDGRGDPRDQQDSRDQAPPREDEKPSTSRRESVF